MCPAPYGGKMSTVIRILAGLGLLTLGRKLFWLFVGVVGFEFGFALAARALNRPSRTDDLLVLVIAILVGVGAALLAIFLKQIAVYVGGFFAGGSFGLNALRLLNIGNAPGVDAGDLLLAGAFIVGGIIGIILIAMVFDWALIVLSSLAGASMIANVGLGATPLAWLAFIALFVVGVVVQARMMARE